MTIESLRLSVRRYRPKSMTTDDGHEVAERLYVKLLGKDGKAIKTFAKLEPISLIKDAGMSKALPAPIDRARAWRNLCKWIEYLIIFPDPVVKEGQYQNRQLGEAWEHLSAERPLPEQLYDWHRDHETLERLRERYHDVFQEFKALVGLPSRSDFNLLYPNYFDDDGLSDAARKAIYDLKVVFGEDILDSDKH